MFQNGKHYAGNPNLNSNNNIISHSDGGRKHFKDKEEVKEEWKSYINLRTEVQTKVAQLQKELTNLRTKQLAQLTDQNLKDQIQEKEYQLRIRHKDLEIVDLQMKHFQLETVQSKLDRQSLQYILGDNYESLIRSNDPANIEEKKKYLEFELVQLGESRAKIEQERLMQLEKQREMQYQLDQMEEAQQRRHQEYPEPKKPREEYKQNMYQNIQRGNQQIPNRSNLSLPFEQLYPGGVNKGHIVSASQSDLQSFSRRSNEKDRFEEMIKQEGINNLKETLQRQADVIKQRQAFVQDHAFFSNMQPDKKKVSRSIAENERFKDLKKHEPIHNELEVSRFLRYKRNKEPIFNDFVEPQKRPEPWQQAQNREFTKSPLNNYQNNNVKDLVGSNNPLAAQRNELKSNLQDPSLMMFQKQNNHSPLPLQNQQPFEPVGNNSVPSNGNSVPLSSNSMPLSSNFQPKVFLSPGIEDKKNALAEINSLSTKSVHNPISNPMPYMMNNPYIIRQFQNNARNKPTQYPSYLANIASSNLTKF